MLSRLKHVVYILPLTFNWLLCSTEHISVDSFARVMLSSATIMRHVNVASMLIVPERCCANVLLRLCDSKRPVLATFGNYLTISSRGEEKNTFTTFMIFQVSLHCLVVRVLFFSLPPVVCALFFWFSHPQTSSVSVVCVEISTVAVAAAKLSHPHHHLATPSTEAC